MADQFMRIGGRGEDGTAKPLQTDNDGRVRLSSEELIKAISHKTESYRIIEERQTVPTYGEELYDSNVVGRGNFLFFLRVGTSSVAGWEFSLISEEDDDVEILLSAPAHVREVDGLHIWACKGRINGIYRLKVKSGSSIDREVAFVSMFKEMGSGEIEIPRYSSGEYIFEEKEPVAVDFVGVRAVLGRRLWYHFKNSDNIDIVKFAPDGRGVSGGRAGLGTFMMNEKGDILFSLPLGAKGVAFDPPNISNCIYIATSSGVFRYNRYGALEKRIAAANANDVCVDPSGNVYVGFTGNSVKKYDRDGTELWSNDEATDNIEKVAEHGDYVYSASHDENVRQMNKDTGATIWATDLEDNWVRALAVKPDGDVVACGRLGGLTVLDPSNGTASSPANTARVYELSVDMFGNVYGASSAGIVRIWDNDYNRTDLTMPFSDEDLDTVAVNNTGEHLMVGSGDGHLFKISLVKSIKGFETVEQ